MLKSTSLVSLKGVHTGNLCITSSMDGGCSFAGKKIQNINFNRRSFVRINKDKPMVVKVTMDLQVERGEREARFHLKKKTW
jgi:hypothetical protein